MSRSRGKRFAFAAGAIALAVLAIAVVLGWPHLVFWYRFEPLDWNDQGFPEYRHRATGIVMVLLPGGTFLMGAQRMDPKGPNYNLVAKDNEGPVHEVTLSSFLIAKYELTQAEWKAFMGENPSDFNGDDLPVDSISWDDIQRFEAKTGLVLPTESQWEYACRGGSSKPIVGNGMLGEMGWYAANSQYTTHPVGKKAPNAFGLHDTKGNVWEWCEDVYDKDFYGKPEARETDPCSDAGSKDRVIRGGSWIDDVAWVYRSSFRLERLPFDRLDFVGCRPAYPWP